MTAGSSLARMVNLANRPSAQLSMLLSLLALSLISQVCKVRKIANAKGGYHFDSMGKLIVTSHELAKRLARVVVQKSGKFPSYIFSGACPNSILGSSEGEWDKQRRIIHAFIIGRSSRFAAMSRSTASHIM